MKDLKLIGVLSLSLMTLSQCDKDLMDGPKLDNRNALQPDWIRASEKIITHS